jgi:SLT domain-containing protein
MPYTLRKAPRKELYWVVGENGKKHSILPLPKARAEAQRRALYAAENGYVLNRSRSRKRKSPKRY